MWLVGWLGYWLVNLSLASETKIGKKDMDTKEYIDIYVFSFKA